MGLTSPRWWWRAFGFARGAPPSSRRDSVGKGWAAWLRKAVAVVLRSGGPIPKHVAIVMDGNRRFAETRGLRKERGHEFGAEKLLDVLEWSLALGVECLSVYAFSTDNFKRSETEVDVLFQLAERRLDEMATSPVIHDRRVRVQVLGEMHMLPPGLRRAAANAMAATAAHNCGPVLNVCFAYTGREDACRAVSAMARGVEDGTLDPADDVTERTMRRCMHGAQFDLDGGRAGLEQTTNGGEGEGTSDETATTREGRKPGAPPVDLLIRTSGETRLSDFMLWGISGHAVLCFQEVLWPDFSFTDMCYAVWTYQRSAEHSRGGRARYEAARADAEAERRDRRSVEAERAAARANGGTIGERRATATTARRRAAGKGSVGSAGAGKMSASESIGTSIAEVSVARSVSSSEPGGGADRFVAERNRAFVRETLETAATVAVTT